MKKFVIIIMMFLFLLSCSGIDKNYTWYDPKQVIDRMDQLQPGDILILSKEPSIRSMWGHSAILNEKKKVIEFPGYGSGYNEIPIDLWHDLDRKISIFRLKEMDDELKDNIMKEIEATKNKPYGLTFNKNFDKRIYCSQLIYIVVKNAAEKSNKKIDLDSNSGDWVMPFDIMRSEYLENIILK